MRDFDFESQRNVLLAAGRLPLRQQRAPSTKHRAPSIEQRTIQLQTGTATRALTYTADYTIAHERNQNGAQRKSSSSVSCKQRTDEHARYAQRCIVLFSYSLYKFPIRVLLVVVRVHMSKQNWLYYCLVQHYGTVESFQS